MLSLSKLRPPREPFDLGDRVIYFRTRADFDMQEMAAWEQLQQTYGQVKKMREKAGSEQQYASAAQKSDRASRELIALVLPDMPASVIDGLTAGQVDQLATMCLVVASGQYGAGSAPEEQLAEAGERFPDLPADFLASLTRTQMRMLLRQPEPEPEKN